MDNYIVINGKKAELTEEQLKALGIEVKKKRNNPFNSELKYEDKYFIIDEQGVKTFFYVPIIDEHMLNNGNCFNDKDFANQVYLHELLNRKLLKYAWDNECEDYSVAVLDNDSLIEWSKKWDIEESYLWNKDNWFVRKGDSWVLLRGVMDF